MDVVSLLIKPASRHCNLRCDYCFYYDVSTYQEEQYPGMMTREVATHLIQNALSSATKAVIFAFQGGEPTLAGLDFFRHFVQTVNEMNSKRLAITYALQTNGTLLTKEWAMFFKDHHFLVGVSLDGYAELHDYHRFDVQHRATYQRVLQGIRHLESVEVPFNILTVVNRHTARHAVKIYQHYRKLGFRHLQFIPALAPLSVHPDADLLALTSEGYGRFLNELFPLYHRDFMTSQPTSIRFFDNVVGMAIGFKAQACEQQGQCALNFVIESNGDVYPCDFYSTKEWHIGNIHSHTFDELVAHPLSQRFIHESMQKDPQCATCPYQSLCLGGCKRHRQFEVNGAIGTNYFCTSYRQFFQQHHDGILAMANTIRPRRGLR